MKTLWLVDEHLSSKQNGVGTFVRNLLQCFENTGHDVRLLSFDADEKEFTIVRHEGRTEYRFPVCGQNIFVNNGALSLSVLRRYVPDSAGHVFFVNHSPADRFLAALHRLFPRSHAVFTIHDQGWTLPLLGDAALLRRVLAARHIPAADRDTWKAVRRYCARERRTYRLADAVIALNGETRRIVEEAFGVPPGKIHVLPNGAAVPLPAEADTAALRRRWGIGADECMVLFIGRTVRSKGIEALLKAFEEVWPRCPRLRLVVAGQVFRLGEFAALTPRSVLHVSYVDLIAPERLAELYAVADVCVLPSYTEQCSYTGMEMMAHGKVIIAADGHCMGDMFDESVALMARIGPGDRRDDAPFVRSLAEALERAAGLTDEARREMGRKARARYEERYTPQRMAERYASFILQTDRLWTT